MVGSGKRVCSKEKVPGAVIEVVRVVGIRFIPAKELRPLQAEHMGVPSVEVFEQDAHVPVRIAVVPLGSLCALSRSQAAKGSTMFSLRRKACTSLP